MKKRVYIAGPIQKGDLCANVNQATAAFVSLAKLGFSPLCPHWSVYSKPAHKWPASFGLPQDFVYCQATAMGNEEMVHADWMGVDLPWVECAHAVLRLPGDSVGADLETAHAAKCEIPVFTSIEDLVSYFRFSEAA